MTAAPILYSFRRCPYAMRARLALMVSGTRVELREVKLSDKPDAMIDASPKATVPVLVLPDGGVIEQSIAIARWALGRSDPEGWLDRDDRELIAAIDGPFKHHLDRYKYAARYDDADPEEHRAAGLAILETLEQRLSDSANLSGDAMGLSDAAIMPFVRQFAAADREWFDAQPLARLRAWLDRHRNSPLFASIMTKHAAWKPGDAPVYFGARDEGEAGRNGAAGQD